MFSQSKAKYTTNNNNNPPKPKTKQDKTSSVWSLCSCLLFWDQWGLSLMSSPLPPAPEPRPLFSVMNHQSACNPTKEWRNTCVLTKGTSAPMAQKRIPWNVKETVTVTVCSLVPSDPLLFGCAEGSREQPLVVSSESTFYCFMES